MIHAYKIEESFRKHESPKTSNLAASINNVFHDYYDTLICLY